MQEPKSELLAGQRAPHDPGTTTDGSDNKGQDHRGIFQLSASPPKPPQPLSPARPSPITETNSNKPCRFFFSNGCKAGIACLFSHDISARACQEGTQPPGSYNHGCLSHPPAGPTSETSKVPHQLSRAVGTPMVDNESRPPNNRNPSGAMASLSKPVPESQRLDPRQFQLNQLRRRFSPHEREDGEATALTFKLVPTDPDFPFEMTSLHCTLLVPHSYPNRGPPSLRVTNPEMERGYQINVERGFDTLVATRPKSTLLTLVNELDKHLEDFLMYEKAQTIKLVANTGRKGSTEPLKPAAASATPVAGPPSREPSPLPLPPRYAPHQIAAAKAKRESDIRQLEARMGRQPLFSKSADGLSYTLPLQIPKLGNLPLPLQSVKSVQLFVPPLYNLEPCLLSLVDAPSKEADAVSASFKRHARAQPGMTLMSHINHLNQNMHTMAVEVSSVAPATSPAPPSPSADSAQQTSKKAASNQWDDRPHVQIIPRPPEWEISQDDDVGSDLSGTDSSEEDLSERETEEEEEDGGVAILPESQAIDNTGPDLGILLSFPSLEMCDRCKETRDVKEIRCYVAGNTSLIKHESCYKCASQLSIGYRSEPMHLNSIRAGYLDLDGCAVVDLLPSHFVPTCSNCSTPYPTPGLVSFRGESTMAICRECHERMSFKIPTVKFLRVSAAGSSKNRPLPRKRRQENLGIVAGQELPRRGRCDHYAKSYRWFRFSCCSKVYACDRCHDAAEEHPNEHANRMICGFCSREQIYRPEDCIHCHHFLIRKQGAGFWEGGKGTRDKVRMNRKDPRKYKRRPGGTVGGSSKK